MRLSLLVLATSLLGPALPAQQPSSALARVVPSVAGCPVSLSSQRWSQGGLRVVEKGSPEASGRALFLHFTPPQDRIAGDAIQEATIFVHGSGAQNRIVPAATQNAGLTETFHLRAEGGAPGLLRTEVTLDKIRNVESVELIQLRYDSGKLWHASPAATCRIAPNGFLPVIASSR